MVIRESIGVVKYGGPLLTLTVGYERSITVIFEKVALIVEG